MINLTQHDATPEQIEAGVKDLPDIVKEQVRKALTFDAPPSRMEIYARASIIASFAEAYLGEDGDALIGGAPYFMAPLERALKARGLRPCYAFSKRVVEESVMPDGSIKKVSTFKHEGFVYA